MAKRRWLDIVEYISFSGSVLGLVASAISQQAIFASAPLTFSILLNLVNRRRLNQDIETKILPDLNHLNEQTAKDSQALLSLRRKVLALPTPDDLGNLKEEMLSRDRDDMARLDAQISVVQSELKSRLAPLEKLDLSPIQSNLAQLQNRTTELETALGNLNDSLETVPTADRVEYLESTIADLVAEQGQFTTNLEELANQPPPDFSPLQEQIDRLHGLFIQLPPPFNPAPLQETVHILRQEMERSIQMMSSLVPRQELTVLLTEIENLRQRQQGLGQSVVPLRDAISALQGQLGRLTQEFSDRMEPGLLEELRRTLFKVASKVRDLQREVIAFQHTEQTVAPQQLQSLQTALQAEIISYADAMGRQLATVQQVLGNLEPTVHHLQGQPQKLEVVQQELETLRQYLQSLDLEVQLMRDRLPAKPPTSVSGLEELQQQLEVMQQAIQGLIRHQQMESGPADPLPQEDPETDILEVLAIHNDRPDHRFGSNGIKLGGGDSTYVQATTQSPNPLIATVQPEGYALRTEELDSQTLLAEALGKVQERLIVMSSWLEQCSLDDSLFQRLERLLRQGIRIDLGWSLYKTPETPLMIRRINQQWMDDSWQQDGLYEALKHFKQLAQDYPERFKLRALATQERLLVCDRAFAILVRHPTPSSLQEEEVGLCTADPAIIQHLIDSFDRSITDSETALTCFKRADTRYDLGDTQGVIADYTRGLSLEPSQDIALNNRGVAYYLLGGRERAIEDFNHALEINPGNADAYFNRGVAWAELGDKEAAIADYTEAIRLHPGDAIAYNNRGLVRSKLGDYEGAEQDYTEAIGINPSSNVAYNNRGLVRSKLGNKSGAIDDYTEALRLTPDDDTVYFNRGAVRASVEDYEGAIEDYSAAIRFNPEFVNAYNNRGFVYQKLGHKQAAIEDFNRALQINPNFANAYNNRGTARSKLKDFEGAIKDFNQALQINPNFANAYNNRGTARSKLKDFSGAIQDFNRALQVNPHFANAYNNRGLARSDIGDMTGAIEDLIKAGELFRDQGDLAGSQQAIKAAQRLQHQSSLADMPY
ncbi:hypothetical protein BST81_13285 [Leptolyngbya sp. 'hensonii']|uniref:tetratricopeptide repeat protein n=1 Tax=Leptolyngbya sp. 'hensonii' TaxID=1922337 RepID=UPI00094FA3ED|nr:tetratricopeptide repeat protein [Leptolyngbya sp. 'hensonii']OLP18008.1 hypothetical protein BST81_13285 [Leptolyngbya sp. 'hensonii']